MPSTKKVLKKEQVNWIEKVEKVYKGEIPDTSSLIPILISKKGEHPFTIRVKESQVQSKIMQYESKGYAAKLQKL